MEHEEGKEQWIPWEQRIKDPTICSFCGKPVVPGYKVCEQHLSTIRKMVANRKKRVCDMDCLHCKYDDCINDIIPPPQKKKHRMESETERKRKIYMRRKANKICVRCGEPLDEASRSAGRVRCAHCAAYMREYNKRNRQKKLQMNLPDWDGREE